MRASPWSLSDICLTSPTYQACHAGATLAVGMPMEHSDWLKTPIENVGLSVFLLLDRRLNKACNRHVSDEAMPRIWQLIHCEARIVLEIGDAHLIYSGSKPQNWRCLLCLDRSRETSPSQTKAQ